MNVREEEGDWDPPTWAAEPMAWLSCLTNGVLPAVVLGAALRVFAGPIPAVAGFAVYVAAFSWLVWTMKPWSGRAS